MDYSLQIKNFVEFYTTTNKIYGLSSNYFYNYFDNKQQIIRRLIYILDKIIPIVKKHPYLFHNKRLLDFGCGTGEHSYFLSQICRSVDCYDPEPSHYSLLSSVFNSSNSFRVLGKDDYFFNTYDTVLLSGVLECVSDYAEWFRELTLKLSFNYLVLVFAPDVDRIVSNSKREFRLYDNSVFQTTTNEKHLQKFTQHLQLIDRIEFFTRENRSNDHKKVVHIYQKKQVQDC